jgi:hypothetical protein
MPETYGKRQRQGVKARKAAAREERRIARNQRKEAIASGVLDPPGEDSWLGTPNPTGLEDPPPASRS